MIVKPRIRGFLCTTAHPVGCEANVAEQIEYVASRSQIPSPVRNAVVIGASGGYGLASRIVAAFGCGAKTLGVSLEREATGSRTATAGWYNTTAFDKVAKSRGLYAESLNGDAFSNEVKDQAIDLIRNDLGKIDLLVYSLAAPVRTHPDTGQQFRSVIKPIDQTFQSRTLNLDLRTGDGRIDSVNLEPATEEQTEATVAVMGGDDWKRWVERLSSADLISPQFKTIAYTYVGNDLTEPIYRGGTIGRAKDHLDESCSELNSSMLREPARASVAVLKAVVTQASTAIPVVPLYFAILFQIMKERGTDEDCIQHIHRLFCEQLFREQMRIDDRGRIRMDNHELDEETQQEVRKRWDAIDNESLSSLADIEGFRDGFLRLYGFGIDGVDYDQDVAV